MDTSIVDPVDERRQQATSEQLLVELAADGGENAFMFKILQDMRAQLQEARAQYFRKPVAHMNMGASPEVSDQLARQHSELRELVFEPGEARADALFQGCRHLAVRRTLLQLLAVDSSLVEDPFTHQILLSGVRPHEHNFVWKTHVPMVDLDMESIKPADRHFMVVDLCRTTFRLRELLEASVTADAAEMLFVAPYDPRMWTNVGGQQPQGGYTFEWLPRGRSVDPEVVKPVALPGGPNFFQSDKYSAWSLYVQPYGSAEAIVFSRREFKLLFGGFGAKPFYHEVRGMRNGFVEVSLLNCGSQSVDKDVQSVVSREVAKTVPIGHVEIPKNTVHSLPEVFKLGRQYDLDTVEPVVVRSNYYERALQQFYTLKLGRDVIPALMRSLHANSARIVYNGAIVTAEAMVDVEAMAVVLEYIVSTNVRAKSRIGALSAMAKLPSAAKPVDYITSLATWASVKAIRTVDVTAGVRDVAKYVDRAVNGQLTVAEIASDDADPAFAPSVVYGDPDMRLDPQKAEYEQLIYDYAEDVFGGHSLPFQLERYRSNVNKEDTFQLRVRLGKAAKMPVQVEQVQTAYDQIFPGNSMIDPTMAQVQAEVGDVKFIVDVQYFRASIPCMFSPLEGYEVVPSRLRTSIGADLLSSFRNLMASLMKRNFNRPRPEAPGDRRAFVRQQADVALRTHGHANTSMLRAYYASNPVTVSDAVVHAWAEKHPTSDVLAAATLLEQGELDPSQYKLMPKGAPKPTMSLASQGSISAGQTVVFHSKDMISLTVGVFAIIISRLLTLLGDHIQFAFGLDEHTSGEWADKYLDMEDVYVTEIDIPKFDKTQDWACFELILYVMEVCGCHPDLIEFWRKASDGATVFNAVFHLVFCTMFGNRSGSGGTLAVNCIVIAFAFMSSFSDCGIIAIIIKGDDSIIVTRRPLSRAHEEYLFHHWGFSMKVVQKPGVTAFCSGFFVKDRNESYKLVRDPVRVIEKLGKALSVNREASYFLDYYVSVVDTALAYDDDVLVANLQIATSRYHGVECDVATFIGFIKYVSSSSSTFLKVLYGFSDKQLESIRSVDDAVETVVRARSSRFTKGKEHVDEHKVLKLNLLDRIMIESDWIFEPS